MEDFKKEMQVPGIEGGVLLSECIWRYYYFLFSYLLKLFSLLFYPQIRSNLALNNEAPKVLTRKYNIKEKRVVTVTNLNRTTQLVSFLGD